MSKALDNLFNETFKQNADEAYKVLKFDDNETKKDVDALINLGFKLGKMVAMIANNSKTMQGKDIALCVATDVWRGMHEDLDHDLDFEKFMSVPEEDNEDDDDESIPELIERVLKELRNL